MLEQYKAIKQELIEFIQKPSSTDEEFNRMALKLFHFQYEFNQPFRKFCRKRRVSPRKVNHYSEIPPVPIDAFKLTTLSSHPTEEAEALFMTSGTTNPQNRGKHYHRDLDVYDLSMISHFKPYMMPDVDKIKMFILFPEESEMPNSSLAHYLRVLKDTFGTKDSSYAFTKDGFQVGELIQELQEAEKKDEPVLVIGATFSFIHLLDECKKKDIRFKLPAKSRIMDTGGAKGRSREVDATDFKKEMSQLFSVPTKMCGNMYGMTELSSQFYDSCIANQFTGRDGKLTKKIAPHWVKTIVIDIEQMKEKPLGEKGIIVHYDLANLNSIIGILTEDMGVSEGDGFYLLGRAEGAEAKGCSLAVEQFMLSASQRESL